MTNLMDESLFRAHFEKVVQHHKTWMREISAKGISTIPAWLHLFDENFKAKIFPISAPEGVDVPHLVRTIIDKARPDAYVFISEGWQRRKLPEDYKMGLEMPYKADMIDLPRDQWKESLTFLAKIRDDRQIVITKGFLIKRKIHNDDMSPIESFEDLNFDNMRARELYFGKSDD